MARISLDPPRTLSYRIGGWFLRRRFGEVLEPFRAMGHHPQMARAYGQLEQRAPRWRRVDVKLKDLADLAAAVLTSEARGWLAGTLELRGHHSWAHTVRTGGTDTSTLAGGGGVA